MRDCEVSQGINVTGSGDVESCVVDSKPDSNLAIDIRSEYSATVTECEINGSVRSNEDGAFIDRFELNRFESSSSYIIDGAPATEIFLNVFEGGDVRITTDTGDLNSFPAEELTLYDPERQLGNYYAGRRRGRRGRSRDADASRRRRSDGPVPARERRHRSLRRGCSRRGRRRRLIRFVMTGTDCCNDGRSVAERIPRSLRIAAFPEPNAPTKSEPAVPAAIRPM
ncbi:hypothetical protein D8S78_10665 [Natrialba swarupiae]|nr:hypothetical protein [Natrialba swarupiae]